VRITTGHPAQPMGGRQRLLRVLCRGHVTIISQYRLRGAVARAEFYACSMLAPTLSKVLLSVTALLMPAASLLIPVDTDPSGADVAIVPPGVFFAIWGLVIIGSWAIALLGWTRSGAQTVDVVAWPLVIAQAGFSVWLLFAHLRATHPAVQAIGTVLTFGVMLASLLVALARLRDAQGRYRWLIAGATGLFAGWSSAAIWLNIVTVLPGTWGDSSVVQAVAVAGAAVTALSVIRALRPAWSYAGAVIWALIGIVISAERFGAWPPSAVALIGIAIVGVVAVRTSFLGSTRSARQ